MLDAYLRELRRELARCLMEEDLQSRLAEAEAHLHEGIASRLELGLSPVEAERGAIAAFGRTKTIASPQRLREEAPRFRPLVVGLAVLFLTCLLGNACLLPSALFNPLLLIAGFYGLSFVVRSYRAGRPAPWTVARIGVTALVCFWLGSGLVFVDSSVYGSRQGLIPRLAAPRLLAEWRTRIARNAAARPAFEAGWSKAQWDIEGLREAGGYRAPFVFPGPISYATVPTAREARGQWRYAHERAEVIFGTATLKRDTNAVERARSQPILNLGAVAVLLPGAAVVVVYAVLAELFAGSFGAFVARHWRGSRRRGVA